MTVTEEIDRRHQEDLERIRNFRLIDDDFLTKCFDGDTASVELVLRIVMEKPDLKVLDVRTQVFVENLLNRSVRFDVLATDNTGAKLNIEIQRSDAGAGRKRARYNSSMMDAGLLEKGEDFDRLPETWVIFITEKDVVGEGLPLYPVERCFLKTGKRFGDGSHILYVNGAYRGDTPIGRLMHDFFCTDAADMYYQPLAERVRFFKEEKEGVRTMCKAMEDLKKQTWDEAWGEAWDEAWEKSKKESAKEFAITLLEYGTIPLEEIATMTKLPLEEIKKLQAERVS